jgi:uncharacterized protein YggE
MYRFTIASVLALTALAAPAQTVSSPPRQEAPIEMISVTGTGKVQLAPDRIRFTVGVETQAATPSEALAENNRKVEAVIAALRKVGAKSEEIQTSNFSIYPQFEYLENRRPRIIGYQVSNNVTVTREATADAGRMLQAAVEAGVNQASGLNFFVADETRARQEGLRKAFADAKAKAETLAAAAGRTVGRAVAITEGIGQAPIYPPPMYAGKVAMAEARDASVPVEQGSQELAFSVSVVFEMR